MSYFTLENIKREHSKFLVFFNTFLPSWRWPRLRWWVWFDFIVIIRFFGFALPGNPQAKPDQFHNCDDAQPNAESQSPSNTWKVIEPRLTLLTCEHHDCCGVKEYIQDCNIFIVGIILFGQSLKETNQYIGVFDCAPTVANAGQKSWDLTLSFLIPFNNLSSPNLWCNYLEQQ